MRAARFWFRLSWVVVSLLLVAGCDSGGSSPTPATPIPSHGLLIARNEGLVLRDMTSGAEQLIRAAGTSAALHYPRWSPDGSRIAFVRIVFPTTLNSRDGGPEVVLINPDGGGERVVTDRGAPGSNIEGLSWTPDGTALLVSVVTVRAEDPRYPNSSLRIERVDVTRRTRQPLLGFGSFAELSPDGGNLVYLTYGEGGAAAGMYLAQTDSSDPRPLLAAPAPETLAGVRAPRFSPDGSRIAFGGVDHTVAFQQAPPCPTGRRWPWQPRIASAHGPPVDIWTVPAGGGAPVKLAMLAGDDPALAWSPDGRTLAAIAVCGLYLIDAQTGDVTRIGKGALRSQIDWR